MYRQIHQNYRYQDLFDICPVEQTKAVYAFHKNRLEKDRHKYLYTFYSKLVALERLKNYSLKDFHLVDVLLGVKNLQTHHQVLILGL